jgi:hypothetical protein
LKYFDGRIPHGFRYFGFHGTPPGGQRGACRMMGSILFGLGFLEAGDRR